MNPILLIVNILTLFIVNPNVIFVNSVAVSDGDIERTPNGAYDGFLRGLSGYDNFQLSTDVTINQGFTIEVPEGFTLTISVLTGDEISRPYSEIPLFTVYGTLIVEDVIVTSESDNGGAIRVYEGGTLISRMTTYVDCVSEGHGGAIYNSGTANLTDVQFDSCIAHSGSGGAIYNTQGASMITSNIEVSTCSAVFGGGVCNNGTAELLLDSASFSTNNASVAGGDVCITGMGSTVTIKDSQFVSSNAGKRGGVLALEEGSSSLTVTSSLLSLSSAARFGGALAALGDSQISFQDVSVLDASLGSVEMGLGGGFYLTGSAVFEAENLTIASTEAGSLLLPSYNREVSAGHCKQGLGKGCGRGVYQGGGIYASEQVEMQLRDMKCFGLYAENSGACLYITGDANLDFNTGVVKASVNTSRAISLVSMTETATISNVEFTLNTGSLYIYSAELELSDCMFTEDVAPSEKSLGGSVLLTKKSTLTAHNITATSCHAETDGGWLWAESSTFNMRNFQGEFNSAGGKGGVIFVDSMYEVILDDIVMRNNSAKAGGVLFARACNYPDKFMDHDLYKGVQLTNGEISYNNAREGGALYGEYSVLYANNLKFVENFNIGEGIRGSTSIFTPDAIYVNTRITSSFGDWSTRYENVSVIEGERLVFDSSRFTYPESGVAIKLLNETTNVGKSMTLLNRNSDLSLVNRAQGGWDYVRCQSNTDDGNNDDGVASNSYMMDYNTVAREMPSLVDDLGLYYTPVCPVDAFCLNDPATLSINCTCDSSSAFNSIYNDLSQCQTFSPTPVPSLIPTVAEIITPQPSASPKVILTNYTVATNPYVGLRSIANLELEMRIFGLVLGAFIAIAFFSSLLVDLRRFVGMSKSEKQVFLLLVMYNFPSIFHHLLCMKREPIIDMLNAAEKKEEAKEKAKFLHKSISIDSNDDGGVANLLSQDNMFRGGSFDENFFNGKSTQSFEIGYGFDLDRQDSFGVGGGLGGDVELTTTSVPTGANIGEVDGRSTTI